MSRPDWRDAKFEIERSGMWAAEKTGPYADSHRIECQCALCCGEKLALEIREFYDGREMGLENWIRLP